MAMAEGLEEEEFAYAVEELQQEEKIELKFQMKFGQQLSTMSSIMARPLERLDKGSIWSTVASIVRPLRMRTGK